MYKMYKQRRQRIQKQELSPYCSIAGTTDQITSSLCVDGSYCGVLDAERQGCTITVGVPSNQNSRVKNPNQFQEPVISSPCYISRENDFKGKGPVPWYQGMWVEKTSTYPSPGTKLECLLTDSR